MMRAVDETETRRLLCGPQQAEGLALTTLEEGKDNACDLAISGPQAEAEAPGTIVTRATVPEESGRRRRR
jgi:hypothetical protein